MDPADTSSFLRLLWETRSGPFARCSPSYLLSSSLERGNNSRAGQKKRGTEWGKFTEEDDTWTWQSICICVWWNKCSRCRKHGRFSPYVSFKALFLTRQLFWAFLGVAETIVGCVLWYGYCLVSFQSLSIRRLVIAPFCNIKNFDFSCNLSRNRCHAMLLSHVTPKVLSPSVPGN